MDTKLPWADSLNFRPAAVAEMMGFAPTYVPKLEEKAGIFAQKQPGTPNRFFKVEEVFRLGRHRRASGALPELGGQIVISVYLAKGGVGKTTTASELAFQFAILGYKVLLADMDEQGDLSQSLGYDPEFTDDYVKSAGLPPGLVVHHTFADLFDIQRIYQATPSSEVIKLPYGEFGPHFIPADDTLSDLDELLHIQPAKEQQISKLLADARHQRLKNFDTSSYDFVILDCPPGRSVLSTNAILAADYIVAPVSLTMYAVKGISRFSARLGKLKESFGRIPEVITVPTFHEENINRVADNIATLRQYFSSSTTNSAVAKTEEFAAALEARIPLSLYKPRSKGARAYRAVANEILQRISSAASKQLELING